MSRKTWYVLIGSALVLLSALLYLMHFVIFSDGRHIWIYLVGDLAFLPLEVLFVTLILDTLLSTREKRANLKKMNMVIGSYFSEEGSELIRALRAFDTAPDEAREPFRLKMDFTEADFERMKAALDAYPYSVDARGGDLQALKAFLLGERDFMVRLLENPLLLEHEAFTDLLWAVFHLADELSARKDLTTLPDPDLRHISGDMHRAYSLLGREWYRYIEHLQKNYPYLFSLAVRTNPFDPDANAVLS